MIFKSLIIAFMLISQPLSLYCQSEINLIEERHYDIDSTLVFRYDSIGNLIYYYKFSEKRPCVDIQFKGGFRSLLAYCDSLYYNRDDYNYDELNARVMYTIFFDHNLKIREVKIIKKRRQAYTNDKYNYDALMKQILLSTEGKWVKTGNGSCKWYLYFGYFYLR